MIRTLGSWVYILSTALIVVGFIELLLPRTKAAGLVRVVIGLCVIAMLLDVVFDLASDGLRLDFDLGPGNSASTALDKDFSAAGETLASATLVALEPALVRDDSDESDDGDTAHRRGRVQGLPVSVDRVRVDTIPRVEVGSRYD